MLAVTVTTSSVRACPSEVAPIERGDLAHVQAFGDSDDAGVDPAKTKVGATLDQLGER